MKYFSDILLIFGLGLLVFSFWHIMPLAGMFALSVILIGFGYLGVRRG